MTIATDNVGNRRQMYIISCMNVPKQLLVQKNEKLILWKWLDDVEVEQIWSEKCTKVTEKNCNIHQVKSWFCKPAPQMSTALFFISEKKVLYNSKICVHN